MFMSGWYAVWGIRGNGLDWCVSHSWRKERGMNGAPGEVGAQGLLEGEGSGQVDGGCVDILEVGDRDLRGSRVGVGKKN